LQKLRHVLHIESSITTTLECESCKLEKHRISYSNRVDNKSSSLSNLIHSDVWGSYRVTSIFDLFIFLDFVDNYSRMSCVCLLTEKTDS